MKQLPFTRPSLDEETIQSVVQVLRSGWLASGPKVLEFEAALSRYLGGRQVRVMTSATAALEICLQICGIGPDDEVITPALGWCSTANMIMRVGARPVFADVDLDSRNIDLNQVEALITPRTRAIMPVHFAGLPVDMARLYEIAGRHRLRVIEDAAHAIGSAWQGRRIGSFGDLVCFSFHPNKNLTTGEGGAIVTDSPQELQEIERRRFHGSVRTAPDGFDVLFPAGKANLSDIAACIGLGQLPHLDEFNAKRRELTAHYFARWRHNSPVRLPERGDAGHCWNMFAPLLNPTSSAVTRREFIDGMAVRGVAVGVHYPPMHLLTAYRKLGYREGQFPNAERIGRETVTLPLFPAMQLSDVDRVVDTAEQVLEFYSR